LSGRHDIPSVNARLAEHLADLAHDLTGAEPTQSNRVELRFRARGSLAVCIAGPHRGDWFDHEAGCGGDPLGLVAHLRRVPMRNAYAWALGWLGDASGQEPARPASPPMAPAVAPDGPPRDDGKAWSRDLARRLWRERLPAGEAAPYLAARGLWVPEDAPLALHPSAWRNAANGPPSPAMLALMTDPATAEPVGVHVTYLRPDRTGKAEGASPKVMLGKVGVIRLAPDAPITRGLGLAEGIETALAVMQRAGWAPVWAATSAGAIARFPVLPGIEALTAFADADGPGMHAARECCQRWANAGREARILAPPAGDWDDTLPRREVAA
jgi:putative DNA primase/helicase